MPKKAGGTGGSEMDEEEPVMNVDKPVTKKRKASIKKGAPIALRGAPTGILIDDLPEDWQADARKYDFDGDGVLGPPELAKMLEEGQK